MSDTFSNPDNSSDVTNASSNDNPPETPSTEMSNRSETEPGTHAITTQQKPDNFLLWSILTTLFLCLPFGIVGLVYAIQVDDKWYAGDLAGATESATQAKRWTIIGAIAGAATYTIFFVLWLIIAVFGVALSAWFGTNLTS